MTMSSRCRERCGQSRPASHGTLYRHFPTREALLLTAYRYDVRELIDAAPVLLADHPPGCAASLARPARDRAAA